MNELPQGLISVREVLNFIQADCYLDKHLAAQYLCLSVRTLESFLAEIPHFRPRGKLLFKRSELDRWMERHRENVGKVDLDRLAEEAVREVLGAGK